MRLPLALLVAALSVAAHAGETAIADLPPDVAEHPTCANVRTWALRVKGFPSYPVAFDALSAEVTKIQTTLVDKNRLDATLAGLCPIVVLPSPAIEAHNLPVLLDGHARFKFVVLSTGLLRHAGNDSQLAFVVGHELSHLAADAPEPKDKASFWAREFAADRGGALYMRMAGYEGWQIPEYFKSYALTDDRYPPNEERSARVKAVLGLPPAFAPEKGSTAVRDRAAALLEAAGAPDR